MATCPDVHYRDEALAIDAAKRAIELEGETYPQSFDVGRRAGERESVSRGRGHAGKGDRHRAEGTSA